MRPKYALWLIVASISSTWYMTDPQAKDSPTMIRAAGAGSGAQVAIVNPVLASPPRIAERSAL